MLGAEEPFAVVQFLLAVGFNCVLREDCAVCIFIFFKLELRGPSLRSHLGCGRKNVLITVFLCFVNF